jgi:putative ABC transport system permease protein
MARALAASSNPLAGVVDLLVGNGELPVEASLAKDIAGVPGVRSVRPKLFGHAKLDDGTTKRNVLVLGIDLEAALKDFGDRADAVTLSPGTEAAFAAAKLFGQKPAVVGQELAKDLPADLRKLPVEKAGKTHTLTRAGAVTARGDLAMLGGYVLVLEQGDAADVLGVPRGLVNRIDVVLDRGADPERVREAVAERVAGRARVQTPLEQTQTATSATGGLRTGFALCGIAALVVGMFLVYNALAVSVAERRHEIGILLSLGATRGQVRTLFTGEAALLGLAGGIVGIPLGIGFAYLGLQPMRSILSDLFANVHATEVIVPPTLIVIALVAGVVVAALASFVPAWQASQERPAEAVRRVPKTASARYLVLHAAGCLALIAVGTGMILGRAHLPPRWGTLGGLTVALTGALASSPLLAALGARLVQPVARRLFPIEWRLAADNLVRSPGRTGLVIGALAAGVALVVQTAGVIRSNRLGLREWLDETFTADLVVTAGSPLGGGEQVNPMDESVGAELRKVPGVAAAIPSRFSKTFFRDVQVAVLAVEAGVAADAQNPRVPHALELQKLRDLNARDDAALVSENFTALHGVGPGDTITLPARDGPVTLSVVGQVVDYSWNLGTIVVNRRDYRRHWRDDKVDAFDVYLKPGTDAKAVKEAVAARYGARYDLQPLTHAELVGVIEQMIERIYGIAYSQLVVVMLVATLGVITSLLISVLQRRREMGLLRSIGAPPGQVIHAVLAEACLMGIFGTVIGILVGIPLQWYVLRVAILEETGFTFPLYIPWTAALVVSLVALATATLAGLGPAIYAVRQRIPEAIAYE